MKTKLNITGGEWMSEKMDEFTSGFPKDWQACYEIKNSDLFTAFALKEEDAQLIAQAGTVANRTGLMPEELEKQRDKLAELLQATTHCLSKQIRDCLPGYPEEQMQISPTLTLADARKLLAEIKGF